MTESNTGPVDQRAARRRVKESPGRGSNYHTTYHGVVPVGARWAEAALARRERLRAIARTGRPDG